MLRWLLGLVAVAMIGLALIQLRAADRGVTVSTMAAGTTPMTVFRPVGGGPAPVILIAHGFAGSQQLMQPFAVTLARNGYIAVTFDFAGHGRNPAPLSGSIVSESGATRVLVEETARVADVARPLGDGRLAVLGHSMATDIIIRYAANRPDVAATVAVSMFSPAVTATQPRNLLVIAGAWEGGLKREALRVTGLVSAPETPQPGVTYGNMADGTARRAAFSPHAEHVSVLYNEASLREALLWLDAAFGRPTLARPYLDGRGLWIVVLLAGVVLLAWPLSFLLPKVSAPPAGAGLGWRALALPLLLAATLTPLILRVVPTHFLPVLVGDYLAVHFAVYGLLTALCIAFVTRRRRKLKESPSLAGLTIGALAVTAFGFIGLVWPIDVYLTSFVPNGHRLALFAAMLAGTLCYFLADEWLTRGAGAARGAALVSKAAFLLSLGLAVALDFQRLFFLLIIVPVIVLFLLVYGLISRWAYARTGHPFVGGIASAVAFAWAIAVTFPLLAG